MAFYKEDRMMAIIVCLIPLAVLRLSLSVLFFGNSKTLATLLILIIVMLFTSLVYYLKSVIYYSCDCSIELSNFAVSFQDAENLYASSPGSIAEGILYYFILVYLCVLSNSNGALLYFSISLICAIAIANL